MAPVLSDDILDGGFRLSLLTTLLQGFDGYVTCVDRARQVVFMSRMLSRDPRETLGHMLEEYIAPAYRATAIELVERAFETKNTQQYEFEALLADGTRRAVCTRILPFEGPDGQPFVVLLTQDVTEQRGLEARLAESLEFRRRVVEHLPDFVVLIDREERIVWLSRPAAGYKIDYALGKPLANFMAPESYELAGPVIQAAFASGVVGQYEARATDPSVANRWFLVRVAPVRSNGHVENVLLVTSDVTERKQAEAALRTTEEQLHRAQRLESLGQLSGGIAHDFNNLLQVIDGNLSFARERLKRGEPISDELDQALRATERAAELTSHLLAIGRRKRVDPKRVELGNLIGNSMRMLRRAIPENVQLCFEPPAQPYYAELDAPQFEQVLINLCVNARDAMPHGGTLHVAISADDAHVIIAVRDSGSGIAPEDLQRVFEPFFTTKGAGSGLGLAVASGIVAAHGGVIVAESDGRHGTTMKIRLPRAGRGSEPRPPAPLPSLRGEGVLLVAEDEPMVRAYLVRLLTDAGYKVLEAPDGARAVELFRAQKAKIDAVLLDVIMPRMDGWQAYLQMEQLKPRTKVLFSTGYAADVLPADFAARGMRLLNKPYKPEVLLAQLHELLCSVG